MDHQPATGGPPKRARDWRDVLAIPSWVRTTTRRSWAVFRLIVLTIACGVGTALILALIVSVVVSALANGTN